MPKKRFTPICRSCNHRSSSHVSKLCRINYGQRKIALISSSYNDLICKLMKKLLLKRNEVALKLEDGTEVDEEYYEFLDEGTELFVALEVEIYRPLLSKLEIFLKEYTERNVMNINEILFEHLNCGDFSFIFEFLSSVTESKECLIDKKHEHPDWFDGLNTKFSTKREVLRNSAETRLRSYLQKLKKDMEDYKENENYIKLLQKFQNLLKVKRYNSDYFDRMAPEGSRLCTDAGLFHCNGAYNFKTCQRCHAINPYQSKESRILFSTWNLDHVIEKSRTIIPALKEALGTSNSSKINSDYFFDLLFEHSLINRNGNLKLVHIACHDKRQHAIKCDYSKLFLMQDVPDGQLFSKRKQFQAKGNLRKKLKCS